VISPLGSISKKDTAGGLLYLPKHDISEDQDVRTLCEKYGAMFELSKRFPSFKVALENLSRRILADRQKWAKVKLFVTAALSMIDMFMDVLMVSEFMREEKTGFAHIMMGSIFVNLGLQLMVVVT
jgi:hypothetical protein